MTRKTTRRALRVLAMLGGSALACASPLPNLGDESTSEGISSSSSGITNITTGDPPTDDSSDCTSTGSSAGPDPELSTSTGPACPTGEQGCACDEGACNGNLLCVDDACTACGNGEVDEGEGCDDGNPTDSDGCEDDCTISAGAAQVLAGAEHVCALFHTGNIKCWGVWDEGRLGYLGQSQDVGDDETPADMPFVNVGAPVVQLALGTDFTCALLDTDEVKCWGSGEYGKLGQGNEENLGDDEEPVAIPAIDLGGGIPIQIAAGDVHACAVMQDGELRCWGRNLVGQLGLPEAVVGDNETPADLPPVNLGPSVTAQQVVAGRLHTCALLGSNDVLCFGGDVYAQLGTLGAPENVNVPSQSDPVMLTQAVVRLAGGFDHTCVAYDTGTIQCWGRGEAGQLGYGDTENVGDDESFDGYPPIDLMGGDPTNLGIGYDHTCVRLATTQIHCWGEGFNGQLGYGNETDLLAPSIRPVNLGLPEAPRMITVGDRFSCATTEGSQVKCWGLNHRGQLGYGTAWTTDLADNEPIDSVGPVMIE
jgi:cysteine-rich repeat protein